MKFYQSGRSMVEMLGVLAIIGVLSVGAIAGYSKAMMKYKLNKQAEQISALLFAVQQGVQGYTTYGNTPYKTEYFKKLNLIPDGMKEQGNYIYDALGNQIALYSVESKNISLVIPRWNSSLSRAELVQSCRQIMQAIKEYQDSPYLSTFRINGDTTITYVSKYWNNCKYSKCLQNISISELQQSCADIIYSGTDIFGYSKPFSIWINFRDK